MDDFELTMQDQPPRNKRLTEWSELIGQTIRNVIEDPYGNKHCDVVIVTESLCWMPLKADAGYGDDNPDLTICWPQAGESIQDFVRPKTLLSFGLIDPTVAEQHQRNEEAKRAAESARRVAMLRAELARLEGVK